MSLNIRWLLSDFYDQMVNIVDCNGGVVVDLVGDELLAVSAILDGDDKGEHCASPASAVRAGIEMQAAFEKSAEQYSERCGRAGIRSHRASMGVGINTGHVVTGAMGVRWRSHFTTVGSAVVDAKRIEVLAHGRTVRDGVIGGLLLSEATVNNAKEADPKLEFCPFDLSRSDPVEVLRDFSTPLYWIKGVVAPVKGVRSTKNMYSFPNCHDNRVDAAKLRQDLLDARETVWRDGDIKPGQNWRTEIRRALKDAYSIVVCLSEELAEHSTSGMDPELAEAISAYRDYGPNSIFLIPIRFSECDVPAIAIDEARQLSDLQYIDLYPDENRREAVDKLLDAIREAPYHP